MLCDHSNAVVTTEKRNYNVACPKNSRKKLRAEARAPDMVSHDFMALNEWKLVASPCFLTYPHQDAGGFGTWITMDDGLKIWVILRPKTDVPGALDKDSLRRLMATDHILHMEDMKAWVDIFILMLTPGSVL
jgi:hypothetical protein